MSKAINSFLEKKTPKAKHDVVHIHDIEDDIERAYKKYGMFDGQAMGIERLDAIVGGLRDGEIILVGGDPNNGKSALAANVAVNLSRTEPVLFITLEMQAAALGTRMRHINGGTIDNLNIMFQSETTINYQDLPELFEVGVGKNNARFVVIDYLQYLGRGMKNEEVSKMSYMIKSLAMKYSVPVMVVVSLRKDSQGKGGKRKWTEIEIDDFMGTGAIGYDADVAMVVSRKDDSGKWDTKHVYIRVIKIRSYPLDYDNNVAQLIWDRTKITDPMHIPTSVTNATPDDLDRLFPLDKK